MAYCECNCGNEMDGLDARGRVVRFIFGHGNRGRKFPNLKHDKQFKKGHSPHNKGLEGYTNAGTFTKGHPQAFFTHTKETKEKLRSMNIGKTTEYKGDKHWNWKGGVDRAGERLERQKFYKYVKPRVLARDDFTCLMCQERGGNLHVDHIKSWADYPEQRFDLSNCRTLCMACHYFVTFKKKLPKGQVWGNNLMLDGKRG